MKATLRAIAAVALSTLAVPLPVGSASEDEKPRVEVTVAPVGRVPDGSIVEYLVSPDGGRIAYLLRDGDRFKVFLDDTTGEPFEELLGARFRRAWAFSRDSQRFACAVRSGWEHRVVLDWKAGAPCDEIFFSERSPLHFGPEGASLAYAAKRGEETGWVVTEDGKHETFLSAEGYAEDGDTPWSDRDLPPQVLRHPGNGLVLTSDHRHAIYAADRLVRERQHMWPIFLDGKQIAVLASAKQVVFSDDGAHFAYLVPPPENRLKASLDPDGVSLDQAKSLLPELWLDGKDMGIKVDGIRLSPDGKHWACGKMTGKYLGKRWELPPLVDGREAGNSSRAIDLYMLFLVSTDTKVSKRDVALSPDGSRVAIPSLSGIAGGRGMWAMAVNGKEGRPYDHVTGPVFSPDSSQLAYQATKGKFYLVVVEDKEGPPFEEVRLAANAFSQDSAHFWYLGKESGKDLDKDKGWRIVKDHKPLCALTMSPEACLGFTEDARYVIGLEGEAISVNGTMKDVRCSLIPSEKPAFFEYAGKDRLELPGLAHPGLVKVSVTIGAKDVASARAATAGLKLTVSGMTAVTAAAMSPDGKFLAVAGSAPTPSPMEPKAVIQFFEIKDGEVGKRPAKVLTRDWECIWRIAFSGDGTLLAAMGKRSTFGTEGAAVLWDMTTGKESEILPAGLVIHQSGVLCFHPRVPVLAFGYENRFSMSQETGVVFWNAKAGREKARMKWAQAAAFSADGRRIAMTFKSGGRLCAYTWDWKSGEPGPSFALGDNLADLSFSAGGDRLAAFQRMKVGRFFSCDLVTGRMEGWIIGLGRELKAGPGGEIHRFGGWFAVAAENDAVLVDGGTAKVFRSRHEDEPKVLAVCEGLVLIVTSRFGLPPWKIEGLPRKEFIPAGPVVMPTPKGKEDDITVADLASPKGNLWKEASAPKVDGKDGRRRPKAAREDADDDVGDDDGGSTNPLPGGLDLKPMIEELKRHLKEEKDPIRRAVLQAQIEAFEKGIGGKGKED